MTDQIANPLRLNGTAAKQICIQTIMKSVATDTSGKWMNKDHLKEYTDRIVSMCIVAVVNTPTNVAKTTHDLDVAQATIENSIKNIKLTFGRDV